MLRGELWGPFLTPIPSVLAPLWSLGYSYHWPILHSPCAPLLHSTQTVLHGSPTHTHIYPPPLSCLHPAGRSMASRVTPKPAAVQRAPCGALVRPSSEMGGGVSIVRSWRVPPSLCLFLFYSSHFMPLHEGSHLPAASHLWLRESLWHFALWACLSPTHFFPYTQDETMLTIFDFSTFPRISYFQFQLFYGFAPPVFTASTCCCVIQVGMLFVRNFLLLMSGPSLAVAFLLFNLLYSVSNLKVVRARLVSSKILCTLSWFIYAINHGTWVNICAICSPASWSTAEQNHIPLFFITEATPVPLSW